MAYFNHAFCKSFLVTDVAGTPGILPQTLIAGQLGAADGSWGVLDPTSFPATLAKNMFYLAQGSYSPSDSIGTHGGYQESIKTKGINPRYITRLWSSVCQNATASTTEICVASNCAPCGENLFLRLDVKGSPALRFLNHNAYAIGDSSGDAAANGGPLPGLCCADTQEFLDPAMALAAAAQMVLADPIITPFVQEAAAGGIVISKTSGGPGAGGLDAASVLGALVGGTTYVADNGTTTGTAVNVATTGGTGAGFTLDITIVAGVVTVATINSPGSGYTNGDTVTIVGGASDATQVITTVADTATYTITQVLNGGYTPSIDPVADGVTACVTFEGAYVDTQFGTCSFDTRDHYEMEPVQITGAILDETGNPCNDCGVVTSIPGQMAQTHGDTVIRHILLHERYLQNPYHQGSADSVRIREIEGFDVIKAAVAANPFYKTYYLQHSIPRLNNPTGTFDNDQYVYEFFVPCGSGAEGEIELLFDQIAALCVAYGNPITFDTDVDQL